MFSPLPELPRHGSVLERPLALKAEDKNVLKSTGFVPTSTIKNKSGTFVSVYLLFGVIVREYVDECLAFH